MRFKQGYGWQIRSHFHDGFMVDAYDGFGFIDSSIVEIQIGQHYIWEYFSAMDWFMVITGIFLSVLIYKVIEKWKYQKEAIRQQRVWEYSLSQ